MTQNKPLQGFSVQFATPCGDGKYDREFVTAFHNSACFLIECGAKIDFAEFPGCADLALARAKIFGNFLRSQHDFLMCIDSDMGGWQPMDILRLILSKKDFVGAAGPKKTGKLEFAANNCSDEGALLPIISNDQGLIQCTEVGMAFMLLSKSCVQKMADAYPELAFDGDNDVTEFAVYDSFTVGKAPKRRRLSEDFAFCHRWRKIGGEIWLLPDVYMTHAGRAVWEGALIQALQGTELHDKKAA